MAKGRYVYYRCRRSYAGNFVGTCDSRYVVVDPLERVVLEQVVEVLSDPQRILDEAKHLYAQQLDTTRLEAVAHELRQVEEQQGRLADLYVKGFMLENILSAKNEELNRQRTHLEAERRAIGESRPKAFDIDRLAVSLPEPAARLRQWVLEASEDNMELILRALQLQVAASRDRVQIQGSVPTLVPEGQDLVTIVRTWGCMFLCNKHEGVVRRDFSRRLHRPL